MTVSRGSTLSSSPMPQVEADMPGRDDDRRGAPPGALDGQAALRPADMIDPLTRQLRQMYGAIADEPIPTEIEALLRRLRDS